MTTITPKNWESFQHYGKRRPPWIKLHRLLLDDYVFACLPVASRALAPCLWLLASEYQGGKITASNEEMAFRFRMSVTELEEAIKPLLEAGFFTASKPLARRKRDATLETETESERETETEKKQNSADALAVKKEFHEGFWPKYPHKIGKAIALKAYLSARSKCTEAEIVSGLERYIASKPPDRPWCNPATFLNQERWHDQPAEVTSGGARRNGVGWYIKPETAEWDAWKRYGTKHSAGDIIYGMKVAEEKGVEFHVKDRWPPR